MSIHVRSHSGMFCILFLHIPYLLHLGAVVSPFSCGVSTGCSTERRILWVLLLALVLFKGWNPRGSVNEPVHVLCSYFPQEQPCWEHQQFLGACPNTSTHWCRDSHTLFSLAGAVPGCGWWRVELSLRQGSWKCLQHATSSRLAWEILVFQCDLLQKMLFWWLAWWWHKQDKSASSFAQCFVVWSLSSLMLMCRIPLGTVEG